MDKRGRSRGLKKRRRLQVALEQVLAASAKHSSSATMLVTTYGGDQFAEEKITSLDEIKKFQQGNQVVWLDIEGEDLSLLKQIGEHFQLHHLTLENVINTRRSKVERFGDDFFIVLQQIQQKADDLVSSQICIAIADNVVITFHQFPSDALKAVRERVRSGFGHIRQSGFDYLVYALIDGVVDCSFPLLETFGERLESLEAEIIENPTRETVGDVHAIKRDLLTMRRALWPIREAINALLRDGPPVFGEDSILHLRDTYDHAVQVIDFVETYRELGADLMDVYLSSISNRMNEVMKVLTIITTIFVPPTFIAGIYGMNFRGDLSPYNLPELKWYYGYPICLCVMFLLSLSVVAMLYWKGWLSALSPKKVERRALAKNSVVVPTAPAPAPASSGQ